MKQEYSKFLADQSKTLSATEREAIYKLASDIPALWLSPTTTVEERKEILRLHIERVTVTIEGVTEKVSVEIHWSGGYKIDTSFVRPVAKIEQLSYYRELLQLAIDLKGQGMKLQQITDILNQQGWRSPKLLNLLNKDTVNKLLIRSGKSLKRKTLSAKIDRMQNEFIPIIRNRYTNDIRCYIIVA